MKPVYLLDTNIISEFIKPCPCNQVYERFMQVKNLCAISAITWQEIHYGISRLQEGRRKDFLLEYFLALQNNFEIIEYDSFAAKICGELMAKSEKSGIFLPYYDSQIAASAISLNMILVSRNTKNFEKVQLCSNLVVESWF